MKANELREKDKTALSTLLQDLSKKYFQLKMQHGSGQLSQNHQLKQVKRDMARVKTVMHELARQGEGA